MVNSPPSADNSPTKLQKIPRMLPNDSKNATDAHQEIPVCVVGAMRGGGWVGYRKAREGGVHNLTLQRAPICM
eukprot:9206178-Pyramimonas_sp.AAC.1